MGEKYPTVAAEAPCSTHPAMSIAIELPIHIKAVDKPNARRPQRGVSVRRKFGLLHSRKLLLTDELCLLEIGEVFLREKKRREPPKMARRTVTQYCSSDRQSALDRSEGMAPTV